MSGSGGKNESERKKMVTDMEDKWRELGGEGNFFFKKKGKCADLGTSKKWGMDI